MIHNYLDNSGRGNHWATGILHAVLPHEENRVLAQLQQDGEQVRVSLTADQAEAFAHALLALATKARTEDHRLGAQAYSHSRPANE